MTLALDSALVAEASGALVREPNTSLNFPEVLPSFGFTATDAFPGLTFIEPVCLASPRGETNAIFVVERRGQIHVLTNLTEPNKTLFLDITSVVDESGEGGLLGLAFHPGYVSNRLFFAYYTLTTASAGGVGFHNRLSRFQTSPDDPAEALVDSEVILINQYDEAPNHNGGDIHFGADGYLYVALGDEGGGHDQFENSQRIDKDFFSGILRIDVDHLPGNLAPAPHLSSSVHYSIPADNPFVGVTNFNGFPVDPDAVRTEFWAVGLRNPWRMSFDSFTGQLWCGDVGQDSREEVDVIEKGGNYGWSYREGLIDTGRLPPLNVFFRDPVLDYPRVGTSQDPTREGNCVVGGVVYRGNRFSQLTGSYIFADAISGNVWALDASDPSPATFRQLTRVDFPAAFGVDPSTGDVLIAELYNWRILRLTYNSETNQASVPRTLAETGAFLDLDTLTPQAGIVPYDINEPFWSDYASKFRWFSVPDTNSFLSFDSTGNWGFPIGTVWIKHFELELTNGVPQSRRRLETRFLVRSPAGLYGLTYRWDTLTNASLVPEEGLDEQFTITDGSLTRTQVWHYPGRGECRICHTLPGGLALGFNTAQLNREHSYGTTSENQLAALSRAGYFSNPVPGSEALPALASSSDTAFSVEHRVKSYLAANCSQCHQPDAIPVGLWDARFSTPISQAGIVNGGLLNALGDQRNQVIRPGSPERSVLLKRVANLGMHHMPPLATSELNHGAIALLTEWITNDLPAQFRATITSVQQREDGQLRFAFDGVPEQLYQPETSPNLEQWSVLGTVRTQSNGEGEFFHPTPDENRFFRVVFP